MAELRVEDASDAEIVAAVRSGALLGDWSTVRLRPVLGRGRQAVTRPEGGGADMAVRCELSDLFIDQCGCRIHAPAVAPREPVETVGQPFAARYDGVCAACEGRIHEGDPIARAAEAGAGYVHADQGRCGS